MDSYTSNQTLDSLCLVAFHSRDISEEVDMPRGLRAQISPNEQRVLLSLSLHVLPENATSSEFEHLMKLDLIEVHDGVFDVTPLGRERVAAPRTKMTNIILYTERARQSPGRLYAHLYDAC